METVTNQCTYPALFNSFLKVRVFSAGTDYATFCVKFYRLEGYPAYGTTASQRSRVTINKNDEAHVVGGEVPNPVARAVTSRETSPLAESQRTGNHGTLEKSDSQREQQEGVDSVEGRQMYANDRIMVNNDNITQRGIPLNDETRSD